MGGGCVGPDSDSGDEDGRSVSSAGPRLDLEEAARQVEAAWARAATRGRAWRRALQGGVEASWCVRCRDAEAALVAVEVIAVAGDQAKGRPPQVVQAGSAT
eukprot:4578286-Alexandrium_andersonii.AAC.1